MDVVAHGLWGGSLYCSKGKKQFFVALLVGMAPDLLSFGVFHATRPGWIVGRLAGEISGPPALSILPPYVFHAYNLTHSLTVWLTAFLFLHAVLKRPPWLLIPWGLHILCDIPTHGKSYFPTPFLWPLPTPFVDGISWSTSGFMTANYACLSAVYLGLYWSQRKKRVSA